MMFNMYLGIMLALTIVVGLTDTMEALTVD